MEECPVCGAYTREVAAAFQEGMRAQAMGPTMADHERIDQIYLAALSDCRAQRDTLRAALQALVAMWDTNELDIHYSAEGSRVAALWETARAALEWAR